MSDDEKRGVNADNASHNPDSKVKDQRRRPTRDVSEADFAAEAHGFTAFENAGQGSTYPGGALEDNERTGKAARTKDQSMNPSRNHSASPEGSRVARLRASIRQFLNKFRSSTRNP